MATPTAAPATPNAMRREYRTFPLFTFALTGWGAGSCAGAAGWRFSCSILLFFGLYCHQDCLVRRPRTPQVPIIHKTARVSAELSFPPPAGFAQFPATHVIGNLLLARKATVLTVPHCWWLMQAVLPGHWRVRWSMSSTGRQERRPSESRALSIGLQSMLRQPLRRRWPPARLCGPWSDRPSPWPTGVRAIPALRRMCRPVSFLRFLAGGHRRCFAFGLGGWV